MVSREASLEDRNHGQKLSTQHAGAGAGMAEAAPDPAAWYAASDKVGLVVVTDVRLCADGIIAALGERRSPDTSLRSNR